MNAECHLFDERVTNKSDRLVNGKKETTGTVVINREAFRATATELDISLAQGLDPDQCAFDWLSKHVGRSNIISQRCGHCKRAIQLVKGGDDTAWGE